ncbi:MAG: SocA family protein [Actinobacteria bacterium]|nr:SocA family protein [Actinomycetota bacterium]
MASCTIRFRYDVEKFVNVVAYLAINNVPNLDKLKVSKLMYFVDKLHLQRYGRPVSGDSYNALPYGPIPSVSLDIMDEAVADELSYFGITNTNVELFMNYLEVIDRSEKYPKFRAKRQPELDIFSDSDIEILDEVIKTYGQLTGLDLVNLTHKEPAWTKTQGNALIDFRLFLEGLDDEEKESIIELLEHDQEDREIFELSR